MRLWARRLFLVLGLVLVAAPTGMAGLPAARLGDLTAHGGMITQGCPTVLIGGMPAARVGDMHTCPMTVPVPHIGGPILPPCSATVIIGGMPAARVGDNAACVGATDTITQGCPTVLIGG